MSVTLKVRRGTLANLNTLAGASGLLAGELYLITDQSRLAVGLSTTTYQSFVKVGEAAGNPMTTTGDLIVGGASGVQNRLGIGTAGQVLMVVGGTPTWQPITTIDDTAPSNPQYGQRWLRPTDGVESVWVPNSSGGSWISPVAGGIPNGVLRNTTDTFTGTLSVVGGISVAPTNVSASIVLAKPAGTSSYTNTLFGYTNSTVRWGLELGNAVAESGSNTGSNFSINRYNDAGAYVDSPISIVRNTGAVTIGNLTASTVYATSTLSAAGSITTTSTVSGGYVYSSGNMDAAGTINVTGAIVCQSRIHTYYDFYSYTSTGLTVGANGYNGSLYLQTLINANPNYGLSFQALHVPGVQAGFRMYWNNNGTLIDFKDNGHIYSSNGWSSSSDLRLKKDLKDIDPELAYNSLDQIRTVTYALVNEPTRVDGKSGVRQMGFIAQDWIGPAPEVVGVAGPSNPDMPDQLTMNYAATTPFITAAMKWMKSKYESEIAALKARVEMLEAARA